MPIRVEAYTAGGIATGVVAWSGQIREALDGAGDLVIEDAHWLPLDGSPERAGDVRLPVDDLLLVVADEPEGGPVHAQWHTIDLEAGPYRVVGEMPTMPGFDPGRALARPTGEFVFLRDARISLIEQEDAGEASAPQLLVNRYTVDRVSADMMLGFFFPGAEMVMTGTSAATAGTNATATPTGGAGQGRDPCPGGHGPGTGSCRDANRCPGLGSRARPERFGLSYPDPAAALAPLLARPARRPLPVRPISHASGSWSHPDASDEIGFRNRRIWSGKERLRVPYEIAGCAQPAHVRPRHPSRATWQTRLQSVLSGPPPRSTCLTRRRAMNAKSVPRGDAGDDRDLRDTKAHRLGCKVAARIGGRSPLER